MKTQKQTNEKMGQFISKVAMKAAGTSVSQACLVFYNQPKVPQSLLNKKAK